VRNSDCINVRKFWCHYILSVLLRAVIAGPAKVQGAVSFEAHGQILKTKYDELSKASDRIEVKTFCPDALSGVSLRVVARAG